MANNEERTIYVLECMKRYCEQHGVDVNVTSGNIHGWLPVIQEGLVGLGVTDYTPEEIFDILLSAYCSNLIPSDERSEEIKGYIRDYCLKWTEMSTPNHPDKVVRPPYVMNGSKLSCKVSYDGSDYSLSRIDNDKMKFTRMDGKKEVTLSVVVSKAGGAVSFTVDGKKDRVTPRFTSPGGKSLKLKSVESFGRESRWTFDKGRYVERGDLIEINTYLEKRYADGAYKEWTGHVKSDLSHCANGKGKYKSYMRAPKDFQSYGLEDLGKAHPDTIVHYLSDYCDNMTEKEMKSVLDKFCIGTDCSGFVSRAVAYAMEHMNDDIQTNFSVQKKTIGLLTEKDTVLNNAATTMKLYRGKRDLDSKNKYLSDEAALASADPIGCKLIYLFAVEKGKLVCKKVNGEISRSDKPEITSLRPGDIVTMALDESFKSGFHIGIVCDVDIDIDGPYFITADSSPATIEESIKRIAERNKKAVYSILKRPDSLEPVDGRNLRTCQDGSGVRYVLHRDFGFFNVRPYLAFRRPYAFECYYKKLI